jgi:hypothetical protein
VPAPTLETIAELGEPFGLKLRGGFYPAPSDGVPPLSGGNASASLVLLGNIGGSIWPAFSASPERGDGKPHSLDRWTRRIVDAIAAAVGAEPLYPFGGPPWHPFQRWAQRAEPVLPSPVGVLIHPDLGLWHAYRGALAFGERLAVPGFAAQPRPCVSCAKRPCLSTCPVNAFTAQGYDVAACRRHVASIEGTECRMRGCLARRACPIGRSQAYPRDEMAFHMAAFLAAR